MLPGNWKLILVGWILMAVPVFKLTWDAYLIWEPTWLFWIGFISWFMGGFILLAHVPFKE